MQLLVFWFVLILGLALGSARAQEGQFCTLTGASEGACRAVAANGNTVLIGAGTQLTVLYHLQAPQDTLLRQVSLHFPDLVLGVTLADKLAYVAAGRGLYLYGMSDPGEPRLLNVLDVGDTVRDVEVVGDRAYLAANFAGLCIVDVSDPALPRQTGLLPSLDKTLDVAGRRVRSESLGVLPAGAHQLHWNGQDDQGRAVASGCYFLQLRTAAGGVAVGKGLLIR